MSLPDNRFTSFIALLLICGPFTRGADFETALEMSDGAGHQQATTRPGAQDKSRGNMETKAGSTVTARWKVTSAAHQPIKDALVHFYVVKVDRLNASVPPLDPKNVLIESALTMDFDPGSTSHASLNFRSERPGLYLVRIEVQSGQGAESAIDYSALDLVVK